MVYTTVYRLMRVLCEPSRPAAECRNLHFECGAFNHSATSPGVASPSVRAFASQVFLAGSASCPFEMANSHGCVVRKRDPPRCGTWVCHCGGLSARQAPLPQPPGPRTAPRHSARDTMTAPQTQHRSRPQWAEARRIVVKIGSSLLVDRGHGKLNAAWLASLAEDVAELAKAGKQVILVSSGAIALGRHMLGFPERARWSWRSRRPRRPSARSPSPAPTRACSGRAASPPRRSC